MLKKILDCLSKVFFVLAYRGFKVPQWGRTTPDLKTVIMLPEFQIATIMEKDTDVEEPVNQILEKAMGIPVRSKSLPSAVKVISRHKWIGIDMVNEGFGLNQAVYMIGTISVVPQGSTILVEEPEIHLHPKAQYMLIQKVLEYAKEYDKQLVVTTHSEHILAGALKAVGSKKLTPEEIKVYYVEKKDLRTKCSFMKVHQDGSIEGGLKGFFEQDFMELRDLLELMKKG